MSTSKRKRKYSQDFSAEKHGRITDSSFAAACDVNNIVNHYQSTGIDPYQDRLNSQRFGDASVLSYEDAMRNKAELDSYTLENPDFLQNLETAQADSEPSQAPIIPPEAPASPPAEPAPQAALGGDSE